MAIKELIFATQQHIQTITGNSFKRTHIYELLSANFGFNSYAALNSTSIFSQNQQDQLSQSQQKKNQNNSLLRQRSIDLGYPTKTADLVSSQLPSFIEDFQVCVINISDLVYELRTELSYMDETYECDDEQFSESLTNNLEFAANKNNSLAHYALALINTTGKEGSGNDYWYKQEQQGRILSGVEKEWADAHKRNLDKIIKHSFHLKEAAKLGNKEALLDLASQFDDPAFFSTTNNTAVDEDPVIVSEIAEKLGRKEDMKQWLIIAANQGDSDAIFRLIEELNHDNLQQSWTWVYLAQLLGTDLTKDDFHAIHENGSSYDDDIGGPMYVDGREGIKLTRLSSEQERSARQEANALYKLIQQES